MKPAGWGRSVQRLGAVLGRRKPVLAPAGNGGWRCQPDWSRSERDEWLMAASGCRGRSARAWGRSEGHL
jgi:hypothetical protein